MKFENVSQLLTKEIKFDNAECKSIKINGEKDFRKDYKAVWNTTQNQLLRIRKSNNILITHQEVLNDFIAVCKENKLNFEGLIKENGNFLTIYAHLKDGRTLTDGVKNGVVIKNNYFNGLKIGLYGYRVKCENGLVLDAVESKNIKIKEMKELRGALTSIINSLLNDYEDKVNNIINEAADEKISQQMCKQLLYLLIHNKKHREKISEILDENNN